LKKHGTEPHILFLPRFLFISDYYPGEPTGEIPIAGSYNISLVCLKERINELSCVD